MTEPLDKKFVDYSMESGVNKTIPALDPIWRENVKFLRYLSPPLDVHDEVAYDEWVERCAFIEDDLHWLLKQNHHKFWCQMIFDETLRQCIDSYLQGAPRSYDVTDVLPIDARKRHDNIHKLMFMVCLRMGTHKESKESYLSPEVFGDIVYENYIFDVPKLMDVCVLYGRANRQLTARLVENIFDKQPRYMDDLAAVVPTILSIFNDIQTKCGLRVEASFSPEQLVDGVGQRLQVKSLAEFQDVVRFLCDTCATLRSFVDVFPRATQVFSSHNFPLSLAAIYENLVPEFNEAFRQRDWSETSLKAVFTRKVRQAQKDILQVFRIITHQLYLQPLLDQSRDNGELIESYLELVASVLGERRFMAHYDHMYPFCDDRDIIAQTNYTVDETRLDFIASGISECREAFKTKSKLPKPIKTWAEEEDILAPSHDTQNIAREEEYGACAPEITGIQLESLISNVKDLLPDLGDGFIEMCLEEYNYNVERVINVVLEDKLPPPLSALDRLLPRNPQDHSTEEDLLSQRRNIYDNDEFDMFNRRDVDLSRIHKGKKERGLGMGVLDDKGELASVRPLYERYGVEDVESMYDKQAQYDDEYDDEYDDTYDDQNVGADDADSAEDLNRPRRFNVKHPPRKGHNGQESEGSSSEDEIKRDLFIEDPAKVRERQAQRYAARCARQGRKPPGQQPSGQPQHDVQGKPKGQGQEKDVARNRTYKEKNKATRVHHNRKALSDKKRKF